MPQVKQRASPVKSQVSEVIGEIGEQVDASGVIEASKIEDNRTRQGIAKKFVTYYFAILIVIIVGVPAYNLAAYALTGNSSLAISFKDAILTYSAVVGPTVGLVVAYYFKTRND